MESELFAGASHHSARAVPCSLNPPHKTVQLSRRKLPSGEEVYALPRVPHKVCRRARPSHSEAFKTHRELTLRAGPGRARSGQIGPDRARSGPDLARSGQIGPDLVRCDQAGQIWPDRARSGQIGPDRVRSGQIGPDRVTSGQIWPHRARSGQSGPYLARSEAAPGASVQEGKPIASPPHLLTSRPLLERACRKGSRSWSERTRREAACLTSSPPHLPSAPGASVQEGKPLLERVYKKGSRLPHLLTSSPPARSWSERA